MKKTPRDIQVRHRLSGAALLGMREPMAPTMAIDAAPRAGDTLTAAQLGLRPGTIVIHGDIVVKDGKTYRATAPAYVSQIPGSIGFVPDDTEEET